MKRPLRTLCALLLLGASLGCASLPAPRGPNLAEVPRITKDQLLAELGTGRAPVVIDVRRQQDWDASPEKIAGAVREIPEETPTWSRKYSKATPLVLYCA
ncbi:MAG: hypothetical protein Kow0092_31910 [Deferrisomatales bacterium]